MPSLFLRPILWIGSRGGVFLTGVLIVVAGTWVFIRLADNIEDNRAPRFDEAANHYFHAHPGPLWLQEAGRDLTALGGIVVSSLVILAVVGYLLLTRRYAMMVFVIIATLGGLLLTVSLKHVIDRQRPVERSSSIIVYTQSFPSGHSALSATIYLTLGGLLGRTTHRRTIKFYFLALAMGATFLIGCSRVYLGAHYPTDVLAGWMVGLVWSIFCWLVAVELQRRRVVEREEAPEALPE